MHELMEMLSQPWPWYVAGPLIGLMVPLLLILGNRTFGISSALRHICAISVPARVSFFNYDWRREIWNLVFVAGIVVGSVIAALFLDSGSPVSVDPALVRELQSYGVQDYSALVPKDLFSFYTLFSAKGFVLIIAGGFLVGFGTRYAGGCTSGHSITGISTMQTASLIATISFMAGGFLVANLVLPVVLSW